MNVKILQILLIVHNQIVVCGKMVYVLNLQVVMIYLEIQVSNVMNNLKNVLVSIIVFVKQLLYWNHAHLKIQLNNYVILVVLVKMDFVNGILNQIHVI